MKKVLTIDVRPIVSKIHQNWSGEGNFTSLLKKKATKELIFSTIQNISGIQPKEAMFQFNHTDRLVTVTFEWKQQENINEWKHAINDLVKVAIHQLLQKDLISY